MRLGALDGLQRSILNLRANWELIPLVWLQTLLTALLAIGSLLPFYFVLDLEPLAVDAPPEEGAAWVMDTMTRLYDQLATPAFWLAFVSSSAVMLALLVCYSFFQAGVLGVLATGDRQAPPGQGMKAAWFRTFSWNEFQGRGGRNMWRFFWLFNLVLLFWLLWTLLLSLALVAATVISGAAGVPAGMAVGCASVLPLLLLFVVLFFWAQFAQAVVADTDCGAWEALRVGLRLLVRRLGAVLLLFLLMVVASMSVAMVFMALSLPLSVGSMASSGVGLAVNLFVQLFQWLVSALIQLTLVGAVVAIARNEMSLEAEDEVAAAL